MKGVHFLKRAALSLACFGMLAPSGSVYAAGPQESTTLQKQTRKIQPVDLELSKDGLARGQVVDTQGVGVPKTPVVVRFQNKVIARTVTDRSGRFSVQNLRGGVHTISAAEGTGLYRFWSEKTAPPKSRNEALVVAESQVVRAQDGLGGIDIITGATLGLSIAALIVAIDTNQKVDDLPTQQVTPASP